MKKIVLFFNGVALIQICFAQDSLRLVLPVGQNKTVSRLIAV
jgi:hypothetical protein